MTGPSYTTPPTPPLDPAVQRLLLGASGEDDGGEGYFVKADGTLWYRAVDGGSAVQVSGGGSSPLTLVRFPFTFATPGLAPNVYPITAVDQAGGTFTVAGDHAAAITGAGAFAVTGSTGNNGSYPVASVVFAAGSTTVGWGGPLADNTPDGDLNIVAGAVVYTPAVGDTLSLETQMRITSAFDGTTPRLTLIPRGANVASEDLLECDPTTPDAPIYGGSWNTSAIAGVIQGYATAAVDVLLILDDGSGGPAFSTQGAGEVLLAIIPAP